MTRLTADTRQVLWRARPGGNVTGSTFITEETIGKQLELLKAAIPRIESEPS
jgi:hypothetical protein